MIVLLLLAIKTFKFNQRYVIPHEINAASSHWQCHQVLSSKVKNFLSCTHFFSFFLGFFFLFLVVVLLFLVFFNIYYAFVSVGFWLTGQDLARKGISENGYRNQSKTLKILWKGKKSSLVRVMKHRALKIWAAWIGSCQPRIHSETN